MGRLEKSLEIPLGYKGIIKNIIKQTAMDGIEWQKRDVTDCSQWT